LLVEQFGNGLQLSEAARGGIADYVPLYIAPSERNKDAVTRLQNIGKRQRDRIVKDSVNITDAHVYYDLRHGIIH
jgi:hypothetical protein